MTLSQFIFVEILVHFHCLKDVFIDECIQKFQNFSLIEAILYHLFYLCPNDPVRYLFILMKKSIHLNVALLYSSCENVSVNTAT